MLQHGGCSPELDKDLVALTAELEHLHGLGVDIARHNLANDPGAFAAAVVLVEDGSASPNEIRDVVKERVAAYTYPWLVWVTDALPLGTERGRSSKREIVVRARPA